MKKSDYTIAQKLNSKSALFINTLKGQAFLAPIELLKSFNKVGSAKINSVHLEFLLAQKLVFHSLAEQRRAFENVIKKSPAVLPEQMYPHFCFVITTKCNFACSYCYQDDSIQRKALRASSEHVNAYFDAIKTIERRLKIPARKSRPITLFGGEPLLPENKALLKHFFSKCRANSCNVAINTNGYYASEFLPLFRKNRDLITQITISLDGPPRKHNTTRPTKSGQGTYNEIMDGLHKLLRLGIKTVVRVHCGSNSQNAKKLNKIFQRSGFYKFKNFDILPAQIVSSANKLTPLPHSLATPMLSHSLKGTPAHPALLNLRNYFAAVRAPLMLSACPSGHTYCFSPDGNIYDCPRAIGLPKHLAGRYLPRLKLHRLSALQRGQSLRSIAKISKCKKCTLAFLCAGGCALSALREHGSLRTPNCRISLGDIKKYIHEQRQWISRSQLWKISESDLKMEHR